MRSKSNYATQHTGLSAWGTSTAVSSAPLRQASITPLIIALVTFLGLLILYHSPQPALLTANPTRQQLEEYYFPIWKRLFLEQNNMNGVEFEQRITDTIPDFAGDHLGLYFRVLYTVTIDWLSFKADDRFLIQRSLPIVDGDALPSEKDVLGRNISLGAFLREQDIRLLLEARLFAWRQKVPSGAHLKYATHADAVAALVALANDCTLDYPQIDRSRTTPGNLEMNGRCVISSEENRCGFARLDLVTGLGEYEERVCAVWE